MRLVEFITAGIETDRHGFIRVSDQLETNMPGTFVVSDVKGGLALTMQSLHTQPWQNYSIIFLQNCPKGMYRKYYL
ncbi:MAG: hypothetical protein CVU39_12180 [Chloroflexi bacterium HGW-Chloroflexi-10]|nr:MAG: hypothetical protein CVU39_12180 [Chloroflexi bacterium HGW-Chloroflexi-10]